ncbi:MAG: EF-hand domain-containing protein [Methylotenera sp.]|nr:EF-hand domain-containing protein [Methylotenera sp.]
MIQLTSKQLSIAKHACVALCVGIGFSLNVDAGDKSNLGNMGKSAKPVAEEAEVDDGLRQTLNLNFSPEGREKLRKALDDYARSIDSDHDRIEERRRAMQESLEARFLDADNDGDGTLDRQEATEKLPQIARHFNQVDINQDGLISLDELEEAQAKILERRKAAEDAIEAEKVQAAEAAAIAAEVTATSKPKGKQITNNLKKRAL